MLLLFVCVCIPFLFEWSRMTIFRPLAILGNFRSSHGVTAASFFPGDLECQGAAVDIGSLLYYLPLLGHGPTTLGIDVPPFAGCNWSR